MKKIVIIMMTILMVVFSVVPFSAAEKKVSKYDNKSKTTIVTVYTSKGDKKSVKTYDKNQMLINEVKYGFKGNKWDNTSTETNYVIKNKKSIIKKVTIRKYDKKGKISSKEEIKYGSYYNKKNRRNENGKLESTRYEYASNGKLKRKVQKVYYNGNEVTKQKTQNYKNGKWDGKTHVVKYNRSEQDNVYYENCTAAKNAGVAPIYKGQPGYASKLDRDNDGIACEV